MLKMNKNKSHETFNERTRAETVISGRIYQTPQMQPQVPTTIEDSLEGMLHQGVVTRRMRMGHMTTPLTAIAAAGVLPIYGVLKQHERPGLAV